MTTILEHLQQALDEMEQAHEKAQGELGTRMMLDGVIDELRSLISRYKRINESHDHEA